MSKLIPKNPHDEFFKAIFGKPENTAEFLRNFLPKEVVEILDLDSLKSVKDSLISKELKSYYSDLLFTVDSKNSNGYVYILFEHKSYKDRLLPLQLLRYTIKLYDRHLQMHKDAKKLPFVVPVVFYHGRHRFEYTKLKDLFDEQDALIRYTPDFEYEFVNITQKEDEKLRLNGEIGAALLLMKHIFDPDFPRRVPEILQLLFRVYGAQTGVEAIGLYLQYIIAGATNADPDELLKTLNEQGGKIMPSLAKKLYDEGLHDGLQEGIQKGMQEGIQKGMQEGMQKGLQEGIQKGMQEGIQKGMQEARTALLDLIEIKFGYVDPQLREKINSIADLQTLSKIRRVVKKAASLDDVLKALKN